MSSCQSSRIIMPVLAITGLLVTAGCKAQTSEDALNDPAPADAVSVRAATAQLTTLHPSIDLVGTLVARPEHTAVVSPQTTGLIRSVMVAEGDSVHVGDELLHLDARMAEAQLAIARASVSEKEANATRLKRGYLPQEIEVARQEVRRAQMAAETLRSKLEAMTTLHDRGEVSDIQYEQINSSLESAEADHTAAKAKLELYEMGTRPEMIAEAEAQLAVAQGELATAELAVEFCKLTSPIEGTVTQLTARQGMFVEPSITLATVVDLSSVFAQVRIPSSLFAKVQVDARVDVYLTSLPQRVFHGKIARLSGQADPDTADIDAFAQVANEDGILRPGLACRVRIWLPELSDVLVVPVAAVADRSGTPVVTVVRNGQAYEIEATLGAQTHENVQIIAGLAPGDIVVTEGGYGLPDGCAVQIMSELPPSEAGADAHQQ